MGRIPGLDKLRDIFNLEEDGTIATLLQGEDDGENKRTVSVDEEGRLNLGAESFDVEIGNVALVDTEGGDPLDIRHRTVADGDIFSMDTFGVDPDGTFHQLLTDVEGNLRSNLRTLTPEDEVTSIVGDRLREGRDVVSSADISGGVTQFVDSYVKLAVFINVEGEIDVTIEASPDQATNWYELPESPLSFTSSDDGIIKVDYPCTDLKFTGSNTTNVTIQLLEVK